MITLAVCWIAEERIKMQGFVVGSGGYALGILWRLYAHVSLTLGDLGKTATYITPAN